MSAELNNLLAVAAYGAVVAAAEAVMIPLLREATIVDIPGPRSSDTVPTPRRGGIPIAAGRAVIGAVAGEAAQTLCEADAWVVPPADNAAQEEASRRLAVDPRRRQGMRRHRRSYVEEHFDRDVLVWLYRKFLEAPAGQW